MKIVRERDIQPTMTIKVQDMMTIIIIAQTHTSNCFGTTIRTNWSTLSAVLFQGT